MNKILFRHLLSLCMLAELLFPQTSHPVTVDRVLASAGSTLITLSDYLRFSGINAGSAEKALIDEKILKNLIEEKIILAEAEKLAIQVSDEEVEEAVRDFRAQHNLSPEALKAQIAEEGLDTSGFVRIMREKIAVSKMINTQVDSKIFITEEEKNDYYNKNRKNFIHVPERIEVKAVFLRLKEGASVTEVTDLKRKALRVSSLLREGESFDRVLEKYSDEPLKSHGGLLGIFDRGRMIPQLDRVAFSMKKGEISDPVWVQDGAYILYIVSKSKEVFKPYEWVREDIENRIFRDKKEKSYNDWIKTLWEKAAVKINTN